MLNLRGIIEHLSIAWRSCRKGRNLRTLLLLFIGENETKQIFPKKGTIGPYDFQVTASTFKVSLLKRKTFLLLMLGIER